MNESVCCPRCASSNVLFSLKRERYFCEECGHEFVLEKPFISRRVFISYGHDEYASLAIRLNDDLLARGHQVWFDQNRLTPGYDWESTIKKGLDDLATDTINNMVVLLLTPYSVRRPEGYCLNEIAYALRKRLRVIPIMVEKVEPPLSIYAIQWLDMCECIPIQEKEAYYLPRFERLLKALEEGQLDFEGTQSRLLSVLEPIEFSAEINRLLQDFIGRQWVFDEVDAWLQKADGNKIFWITGAPGVGKSAIAAWVRDHRREIAAFHFCIINSVVKRDPARIVRSIAYQLSTQLPEYEKRLAQLSLEGIVHEFHDAYTLFDMLIVQPLVDFPIPDRTVIVLIDALDEATSDRKNEIVTFLAKCADATPCWLRFLVTSRPEPETAALKSLDTHILDITARPDNLADLEDYLKKRFPSITLEQTADIIHRSEGVFLYIRHVCDAISKGQLSLQHIDDFPRGLAAVYLEFFERQFGSQYSAARSYYEEKITPLLQPVLAAFEPLTLGMLKELCEVDNTEFKRRLTRLGSLFPTSGDKDINAFHDGRDTDTLRPFHRSIVDWLTNSEAAGDFTIDVSDGHDKLADLGWAEFQANPSTMTEYFRHYLPLHLLIQERWTELLILVMSPSPGVMSQWVDHGDPLGVTCCSQLLNLKQIEPVDRDYIALQLARLHNYRGEYDLAERLLTMVLEQTFMENGRRSHAVALHEMGSIHLYRYNLTEASNCYRQALDICRRGTPQFIDEAAANLTALAILAFRQYQWQEMLNLAEDALSEATAAGDYRHAIAAQRLIAIAREDLGLYAEALAMLQQALHNAQQQNAVVEVSRLYALLGSYAFGEATRNLEQPLAAVEYFLQAIEEGIRIHNLYCINDGVLRLGWAKLACQQTDDAVAQFTRVINSLPSDAHPEMRAGAQLGLIAAEQQYGHTTEALHRYRNTRAFTEQINCRGWTATAWIGEGAIYWHAGDMQQAQYCWGEARKKAQTISPRAIELVEANIQLCKTSPTITPR